MVEGRARRDAARRRRAEFARRARALPECRPTNEPPVNSARDHRRRRSQIALRPRESLREAHSALQQFMRRNFVTASVLERASSTNKRAPSSPEVQELGFVPGIEHRFPPCSFSTR
jgi:hypothetical protein